MQSAVQKCGKNLWEQWIQYALETHSINCTQIVPFPIGLHIYVCAVGAIDNPEGHCVHINGTSVNIHHTMTGGHRRIHKVPSLWLYK